MSRPCPCCGWNPGRPDLNVLASTLPLSPMQRRIFRRLARTPGQEVCSRELADHVYRDDPDGGPDGPENSIGVQLHKMRPKLAAAGLEITRGRGHDGARKLVWIDGG